VDRQRRQVETIRTLQTPLIESERGTGLLVVVGYCDIDRVWAFQSDLFDSLRQRALRKLVVDVSGADFQVESFDAFVQVLQAARLMVPDIVVSSMSSRLARVLTEDRERVRDLRRTVRFVQSLREAFTDEVIR
jgi:anti-anti-sigma regulatory factor